MGVCDCRHILSSKALICQATSSEAITKLLQVFPHILSYITSFIVIGVLWINHHALFHFLKQLIARLWRSTYCY